MSAARKTNQDWEEKTSIDARPATQFAATVSGERSAVGPQDLVDLFGDEDEGELEATCVREVDSSLLKAASHDEPPPTVPRPLQAGVEALPTPVMAFEAFERQPQTQTVPPASMTRPSTANTRWRSLEVAVALAFFLFATAGAMLVVYYTYTRR